MQSYNETKVTHGALAASLSVLIWWMVPLFVKVDVPEAVVAASVGILTAILQAIVPTNNGVSK